ncbi:VanZ like family protein [Paenibacillus konkukensis]|uniref:VanZ like family protein n=1 Tax=Paenibacillus konkukensis TaxID=2020716 RepID=A0ABY4RP69_9BACL|nr:VanZ family protein [Paenibacillus konkukensis]UQZ83933.1 VanZ like family protein [Paenibacillus konkukensis]
MRRKKWKFLLWLALTCAWLVLIFVKSAQTYSEQDIRPLLAEWLPYDLLMKWLPHIEFYYDHGLVTSTQPYDFIEFFIRKGGHVTEYLVLCFLSVMTLLAKPAGRVTAVLAGTVFSVLYAASDEWHQSFVAGRTGHAIDVGVDAIGAVLMALIFTAVFLIAGRKK